MIICPNCGKSNPDNSKFCLYCGYGLSNLKKPERTGNKRKIRMIILIGVLSILMILGLTVGMWFFISHQQKKPNNKETSEVKETSGVKERTEESDDAEDTMVLKVESFSFVRDAFECGSPETETKVLAIVNSDDETDEIKLIAVCSENGDKIELTDDGKGADEIAGDHAFYGKTSFSSEHMKVLTYKLTADDNKVRLSETLNTYVKFYTLESYQEELDQEDMIKAKLDIIAAEFEFDESQSVETAAENYLEVSGKMKSFLDKQVAKGVIVSYEWDAPYFLINMPLGGYIYTFGKLDGIQAGGIKSKTGSSGRGHTGAGRHDNNNPNVLLMQPFEGDLNGDSFREAMDNLSDKYEEYIYDERVNTEVSKDLLKSLTPYRIVVLNSHGGVDSESGSYFGIGTLNGDISHEDYSRGYFLRGSSGQALVTPKFFEENYDFGDLNDCLFYLGCCRGANNPLMAATLLRKGANAVLCYENTVSSSYDDRMIISLVNDLMKPDKDNPDITHTVKEALEEAKRINGEKDPIKDHGFFPMLYRLSKRLAGKEDEVEPAELLLFESRIKSAFRLIKEADRYPFVPSEHSFGIVGSFEDSGWGYRPDITMNPSGNNVWSGEVTMKAEDEFKVRADSSWEYSWGDGRGNCKVNADGTYIVSITFSGDTGEVSFELVDKGEYVSTAYYDSGSVNVDFKTYQSSFNYSYRLPKIREISPEIGVINDEIMGSLRGVVRDSGGSGEYVGIYNTVPYEDALDYDIVQEDNFGLITMGIDYESAENEDILCVRMKNTVCPLWKGMEFDQYMVYSVDLSTGQRLYGKDVLDRFAVTEEGVRDQLEYEIRQESKRLCFELEGYDENSENIPDWMQDRINEEADASISLNDFDEILKNGIYLDSDGYFQVFVQIALGASSEYSICVKIDPMPTGFTD